MSDLYRDVYDELGWKLTALVCAHVITPKKAAWFLHTWKALSECGHVDSSGSAEFVRVLAEWALAGAPISGAFLVAEANISSTGERPVVQSRIVNGEEVITVTAAAEESGVNLNSAVRELPEEDPDDEDAVK